MEFYGISLTTLDLVLFGVLLWAFFHQLYFYLRYMNGVLRTQALANQGKVNYESLQPPVSVIICAKDEAASLTNFLPEVLAQDYPCFEVIVINDGSTDATAELLRELSKSHSNLRTTFVPVGANNLSTKKLGITLGIKASKYEHLLFIDADCVPEGRSWIARMMRNFSSDTDFVLGYGAYLKKGTFLNRLITYDTLFIGLQYMGMALAGKPYMGVGRNLAYRKEAFYKQNGFSQFLGLASGDDDLLVNKGATARNTRVEFAPDSITWSEPNVTVKGWLYQKQRHLSVSGYYSFSSKFRLLTEPFSRGVFYLFCTLTMWLTHPLLAWSALILFLVRFAMQTVLINRSSRHFGGRTYYLTLLLFDIYLPLVVLFLKLSTRKGQKIRWK